MKDLQSIANDILRDIYQETEPPLDFDDVLENPDEYGDGWFLEHELDSDRQMEIVDKHLEKNNLSKKEENAIRVSIFIGCGPTDSEYL